MSLDLYEGETFAIVGESGSGKSVFTKTFTGMLESNGSITNGSVMFEGKDLTKLKTDKDWEGIRGAKISTIFQDPMTSLNPIRTIGSQITEVIEKHQGFPRRREEAGHRAYGARRHPERRRPLRRVSVPVFRRHAPAHRHCDRALLPPEDPHLR